MNDGVRDRWDSIIQGLGKFEVRSECTVGLACVFHIASCGVNAWFLEVVDIQVEDLVAAFQQLQDLRVTPVSRTG